MSDYDRSNSGAYFCSDITNIILGTSLKLKWKWKQNENKMSAHGKRFKCSNVTIWNEGKSVVCSVAKLKKIYAKHN